MIRSLTDQRLLHVFLVVLLGEDGGIGKDIEPEIKSYVPIQDLIDDDRDDDVMSTKTGSDDGAKNSDEIPSLAAEAIAQAAANARTSLPLETDEEWTLRLLLINRIDAENHELSLASLRFFDTILETYNQFAIYNLVLRNYLDISPDGEYIEDEARDTTDTSSLGSKVVDNASIATVDEQPKVDELAIGDIKDPLGVNGATDKKNNKTEKVRWLVER
jgi:hypothetical protein